MCLCVCGQVRLVSSNTAFLTSLPFQSCTRAEKLTRYGPVYASFLPFLGIPIAFIVTLLKMNTQRAQPKKLIINRAAAVRAEETIVPTAVLNPKTLSWTIPHTSPGVLPSTVRKSSAQRFSKSQNGSDDFCLTPVHRGAMHLRHLRKSKVRFRIVLSRSPMAQEKF